MGWFWFWIGSGGFIDDDVAGKVGNEFQGFRESEPFLFFDEADGALSAFAAGETFPDVFCGCDVELLACFTKRAVAN